MKPRREKLVAVMVVFVLVMACTHLTSAQSFKKVAVQGKATMMQVASGGMSVWGLATNGHPYVYKANKFVLANTISLTQIAVGGGNLRQPDTVWALDSAGKIYNASKSGTSWVFTPVAGSGFFTLIAAGPGYQDACHPYEVWGLNSGAQIFRYDFCRKGFDTIPGILCSLAVGGGDIWGNDCNDVFFRFDWRSMSFQQAPETVFAFAVGPDSVWALTPNHFVYDEVPGYPSIVHSDSPLTQIQAGGDGVWGLDASGSVLFLRYSQSELVRIPNILLASISVGSGGGVWGIDSNGQVFAFSTQ